MKYGLIEYVPEGELTSGVAPATRAWIPSVTGRGSSREQRSRRTRAVARAPSGDDGSGSSDVDILAGVAA